MTDFRVRKIEQSGSDEPSNLIALTIPNSILDWLVESQLLGSEKFAIAMRPDEIEIYRNLEMRDDPVDGSDAFFRARARKKISAALPRMMFGVRLHGQNSRDFAGQLMVGPYIDTLYEGAIDYVLFADGSNWIFFGETSAVVVQGKERVLIDYEVGEISNW